MANRKKTELIVIHCAATPPDLDIGAAEIRKWHKKRGWSDIGYHFVIRRDGRVEKGRARGAIGAHAKGHNSRSIGVCLVGGVDKATGKPAANFTDAQWKALEELLLLDLTAAWPNAEVVGHRDLTTKKACPSFDAKAWWAKREKELLTV